MNDKEYKAHRRYLIFELARLMQSQGKHLPDYDIDLLVALAKHPDILNKVKENLGIEP